jgi:Protein of unknown function (DUF3987)/Primase C terminal 2 (PriCT-2)
MTSTQATTREQINSVAEWLQEDNSDRPLLFVPGKHDSTPGSTKKPPLYKSWKNGFLADDILSTELEGMRLNSLLLHGLVALDMDSDEAYSLVAEKLKELNLDLDCTFRTYREGTTRGALFFSLPHDTIISKFTYLGKSEQVNLEVRSGLCYQVVAGEHPDGTIYQNNGDTRGSYEILQIPPKVLTWIQSLQGSEWSQRIDPQEKPATKKSDFDELTIEQLEHIARWCIHFKGIGNSYQEWMDMLMIVHYHFPDEEGRDLADRLSQYLDDGEGKYDARAVDDKWLTINDETSTPKTVATYYGIANRIRKDLENGQYEEVREGEDEFVTRDKRGKVTVNREMRGTFNALKELSTSSLGETYREAVKNRAEREYDTPSTRHELDLWIAEMRRSFPGNPSVEDALEREIQVLAIKEEGLDGREYQGLDYDAVKRIWAMLDPTGTIYKSMEVQGLDTYLALQNFICTAGTLTPKGEKFWLNYQHKNPTTKYVVIYGETSSGKDLMLNFFTAPHKKLDLAAMEKREEAIERYKELQALTKGIGKLYLDEIKLIIQEYSKLPQWGDVLTRLRNGEKVESTMSIMRQLDTKPDKEAKLAEFWQNCPEDIDLLDFSPPKPKSYLLTQGSAEGARDHAILNGIPLFWIATELDVVFQSLISKDGTDIAATLLIQGWNAALAKDAKVASAKAENAQMPYAGVFHLSLIGAIQPEILPKLINLSHDEKGVAARIDFVSAQNNKLKTISILDDRGNQILETARGYLNDLYFRMDGLMDLYPDKVWITVEASEYWRAFQGKIEALALEESNNGQISYSRWLKKLAQKVGHECAIIHCLRYAQFKMGLIDTRVDIQEQDIESMKIAIAIAEISMADHKQFFAQHQLSQTLTGELLWILEYLTKKNSPVTVTQLQQHGHFRDNKVKADEIRSYLVTLEELEKITKTPKGWITVKATRGKRI